MIKFVTNLCWPSFFGQEGWEMALLCSWTETSDFRQHVNNKNYCKSSLVRQGINIKSCLCIQLCIFNSKCKRIRVHMPANNDEHSEHKAFFLALNLSPLLVQLVCLPISVVIEG